MPTAFITGITGQDGSYLAEFLLAQGYTVVGLTRRTHTSPGEPLADFQDRIILERGDLLDQAGLAAALARYQPDEIYNLAAQSFVPTSDSQPILTGEMAALGVARLLEAVRVAAPAARFYQASTSEMFAAAAVSPQSEATPFAPRSPYGVAKLYGHWMTAVYRDLYGLFAVSGILYNHESPRRGLEFVTRKITHTAARIKLGLADELRLGNLEAVRDWGFAGDYVQAMWRMLQQPAPEDFVIGTGEAHTVREFCAAAFGCLGLDYADYVIEDPQFYRPTERFPLVANPANARLKLGWQARTRFEDLVRMMVDADMAALRQTTAGAGR